MRNLYVVISIVRLIFFNIKYNLPIAQQAIYLGSCSCLLIAGATLTLAYSLNVVKKSHGFKPKIRFEIRNRAHSLHLYSKMVSNGSHLIYMRAGSPRNTCLIIIWYLSSHSYRIVSYQDSGHRLLPLMFIPL